jgi:lipopolysaccharide exporter
MSKPSTSFTENVLKLVTGNIFAQGLGILTTPIIARFFAPEAFGVVALFTSITAIIGVIACLRYELAIMHPVTDDEASNLLGVSLGSGVFITIITALGLWGAGGHVIRLLNVPELGQYLWLIPVSVFVNGIFLGLNSWNSRTKHFGRLSIAQVVTSTTTQATKIIAGLAGYVNGGILIGTTVLGSIVATSVLGGQIWRDDRGLFKTAIHWKKMRSGLSRYRKFPLIDVWGALLNTISWQLPALLLATFFSPNIVGYYALGNTVIRMPMNIIGGAIAQVFYQRACDAKNKGDSAVIVADVYRRLVAIGLFPLLVLSIIGQDIFVVIFGHNWSEAGVYSQILAPWMFLTFISSPLSSLFIVYERQGAALIVHSIVFLTRLLSLYIGGVLGSVYLALGLFSITGVFVYGGVVIWNMQLAKVSPVLCLNVLLKYLLTFIPIGLGLLALKFGYKASSLTMIVVSSIIFMIYMIIVIHQDATLNKYVKFRPFRGKGA